MDQLTFIFTLIAMTAASGILGRYVRWMPMPWVQIFLGAIVATFGFKINFDPSIFMALFIPPLLFADAWRIPKRELVALARPIISLATSLVLLTVIGGGYFINWLIPDIPLAVAFILAAVLSPTDAVAVSAVTSTSPMPSKMHHILEGESLFNDASGLVAFKVALAAMLSGSFSMLGAGIEFVQVALGGLIVGAAIALVFSQIVKVLINRHGDTLGQSISLSMITMPFASFLLAEHFHFSGILAAVAAGIVLNYRSVYFQMSGAAQISIGPLWSVIAFAFNGIIFILLGSQIPDIAMSGIQSAQKDFGIALSPLFGHLILVTAGLLMIRFLWIATAIFVHGRKQKNPKFEGFPFKIAAGLTVAGIRGAVTLAAVLSLPLTIAGDIPFPGRDLVIFLATGVILVTLAVGTFTLPLFLKGTLIEDDKDDKEEKLAKIRSLRAGIEMLSSVKIPENELTEAHEEARSRLIMIYQKRSEAMTSDDKADDKTSDQVGLYVGKLWSQALKAEREEIYKMRKRHKISDRTLQNLINELDFAEKTLKLKFRNG